MTKGTLYVISALSLGKTSLISALLQQVSDIEVSVSHHAALDGVNYHFIDKEKFAAIVEAGDFFESALVFGNMYGTSRQHIQQQLLNGKDVSACEIDWQGARQIRQQESDCKTIYSSPPVDWPTRAIDLKGAG